MSMSRRPYIENLKIADEYRTGASSSSRPRGYISGSLNKEVVGMDGRVDYFRGDCRECGRTHITRRGEKSSRYYACQECGTWHHINRGFFNHDRFETVPLKNDEFSEQLYRIKMAYSKSSFDDPAWFYGSKDYLREKAQGDFWETVEPIEEVQ
ncbi:hypothetical protein M199_gp138 [Halogranum tailed virus 1]|uniref:Uncharacterized protein n=1 Tax=Halogranum tailed virus 1 TaxID=1273749 RepID=R4TMV9_9CAUD|nr:hypothetical protein M199_gp138 [Halogranum tailed virus 1]AGM11528.1 hypothetical protein HGTV1_231 [Halogranum tailed virus 1]